VLVPRAGYFNAELGDALPRDASAVELTATDGLVVPCVWY
jgi:hypothetical protein